MTAINRNNYETYFLDYIEGTLNEAEKARLIKFLDAHPDLKEELEGLEMVKLEPDNEVRFQAREALKKPLIKPHAHINGQNYEEYFVAATEGDLSESEQIDLSQFLKENPWLKKDFDLFTQCHLLPDPAIVFADKASLKRTVLISLFSKRLYYGIAVAASIALLAGLALLFEPDHDRIEGIAEIKPEQLDESLTVVPEIKEATRLAEDMPAPEPETQKSLSKPEIEHHRKAVDKKVPKTREIMHINHLASLPAPQKLNDGSLPEIETRLKSYFTNYYPDIALAQNIRHADDPAEESFAGKLLAQGATVVREVFHPTDQEIQILPEQINLWKIADAGINGFARITGADMEFKKQTDEEGRVVAFAFESQSMQINRNLRKNK